MRLGFYPRWIIANAMAEGIGLGATLILGMNMNRFVEPSPPPLAIVGTAFIVVTVSVILEGVLIGIAQGWVLRWRVPSVSIGRWTVATSIGAGIAWSLEMIPSTIIALISPAQGVESQVEPTGPPALLTYPLAAIMGLILGPMLALFQVRVLRQFVSRPHCWLGANAPAWAIGMPLIFLGMDLSPWNAGPWAIGAAVVGTCTVTGAVVGAIHGWFLNRALPVPDNNAPVDNVTP
jgi:hypothetical protein